MRGTAAHRGVASRWRDGGGREETAADSLVVEDRQVELDDRS